MIKKIMKEKTLIEMHRANRSKAKVKRERLQAKLQQSPKMISSTNIRTVTLAEKMLR